MNKSIISLGVILLFSFSLLHSMNSENEIWNDPEVLSLLEDVGNLTLPYTIENRNENESNSVLDELERVVDWPEKCLDLTPENVVALLSGNELNMVNKRTASEALEEKPREKRNKPNNKQYIYYANQKPKFFNREIGYSNRDACTFICTWNSEASECNESFERLTDFQEHVSKHWNNFKKLHKVMDLEACPLNCSLQKQEGKCINWANHIKDHCLGNLCTGCEKFFSHGVTHHKCTNRIITEKNVLFSVNEKSFKFLASQTPKEFNKLIRNDPKNIEFCKFVCTWDWNGVQCDCVLDSLEAFQKHGMNHWEELKNQITITYDLKKCPFCKAHLADGKDVFYAWAWEIKKHLLMSYCSKCQKFLAPSASYKHPCGDKSIVMKSNLSSISYDKDCGPAFCYWAFEKGKPNFLCEKKCASDKELYEHFLEKHYKSNQIQIKKENKENEKKKPKQLFFCSWLGCKRKKEFKQKGGILQHVHGKHLNYRPILCEICGLRFKFKGTYDKHYKTIHA